MKNFKKEPNNFLKILSVVLMVVIPVFFVNFLIYTLAWNPPTESAPTSNVPSFLSVSNQTQFKEGALGVGGVFQTDSATHLALSGGNVGIGTNSPTAKLHVNGEVKATSFTGDGSGLTNLNAGISSLSQLSIDSHKNWGGYRITNVGEPTNLADAATKGYVDSAGGDYMSCPGEIEGSNRASATIASAISTCRGLAGDWYLPTAEELACFIGIGGVSSDYLWTRSPSPLDHSRWIYLRLTDGHWGYTIHTGTQPFRCVR